MEPKVPIAARITVKNKVVAVWVSALIFICFSVGCEKRRLIEPTPGMECCPAVLDKGFAL